MKFLIIRFSSIGDIVLTTPVMRCLRTQVPSAEIHYLTKQQFLPVLASNPNVDRVHLLQDDLDPWIEALKQEDYDYVIDLHNNLRSKKVITALGKASFSFPKRNIQKWMLVNFKINKLPAEHVVDRYMQTLNDFKIKNDGAGLDYFIPEKEVVAGHDIPASHHAGYIALVIGATYFTKRYPVDKLRDFCELVQHPVILIGGKDDAARGAELSLTDNVKIYNACGKFSLNESADLVRRAKVVISNDTGFMHIAAAFKRPVVSLWGNTVPAFGMYPYYGANFLAHRPAPYRVLETLGLSCRPCSKIGYNKCPRGHFKCMNLIESASILAAVNELLK